MTYISLTFALEHVKPICISDKTLTIRDYSEIPVDELIEACEKGKLVRFKTPNDVVFATAKLKAVWLTNAINIASSAFTEYNNSLNSLREVYSMLDKYYDKNYAPKSDLVAIRFEINRSSTKLVTKI